MTFSCPRFTILNKIIYKRCYTPDSCTKNKKKLYDQQLARHIIMPFLCHFKNYFLQSTYVKEYYKVSQLLTQY